MPRSAALDDLVGFLSGIMRGEQTCSTRVAAGLMRWIADGRGSKWSLRERGRR